MWGTDMKHGEEVYFDLESFGVSLLSGLLGKALTHAGNQATHFEAWIVRVHETEGGRGWQWR